MRRDLFEAAGDALFDGDSSRAAELLERASAVDPNQIADLIEQRTAQRGALDQLFTDYPALLVDPDMQLLADRYTAAHITNGMSAPDAIAKAGQQLGERFPDLLGVRSDTVNRAGQEDEETPQSIIAELRAARETGQRDEDLGAGNHGADASTTIAEMRELRTGRTRTSS